MSRFTKVALFIMFTTSIVYNIWHHTANAGALWGEYHVGSNHSEQYYYDAEGRHEFNENNAGGGISYEVAPHVDVIAGFYKNSYHNSSEYAGVDIHTGRWHGISVGVSAGLITGYEDTPVATKYMVLPNVVIGNRRSIFRTKVGVMPIGKVRMLTLSLGVNF